MTATNMCSNFRGKWDNPPIYQAPFTNPYTQLSALPMFIFLAGR